MAPHQNDEHIDVLTARAQTGEDGVALSFDDAWRDRVTLRSPTFSISSPSVAHLIITKRWSMRQRDIDDIRFLEALLLAGKKA